MFLITCILIILCHDVSGTCYSESVIDCEYRWSNWSDCDPCTHGQSQFLTVIKEPNEQGVGCPDATIRARKCKSTEKCSVRIKPCDTLFTCRIGECVEMDLVCNGENDCLNNHDEYNCTTTWKSPKCDKEPIPYLSSIGLGYDIVNDKPLSRVIDVQRFNGFCNIVQDSDIDKYYRLPASIATSQSQVKASGVADSTTYSSTKDFSADLEKNSKTSVSTAASFEYGYVQAAASMSYQHSSEYKSILDSSANRRVSIVKTETSVELAQFMLRRESLVLIDPHFNQAVLGLPSKPDAIAYTDFFDQFGVAYAHAGTLGGVYRNYYSFDQDVMKKSNMTSEGTSDSLKAELSARMWGGGASVQAAVSGAYNSSKKETQSGSSNIENSALKKTIFVRGGNAASAGALANNVGGSSSDGSRYDTWVDSLKSNPYLLSKEYRPVCELIRYTRRSDAEELADTCIKMARLYLTADMTDSCTCKHGGKPVVLSKNRCSCACSSGYTGAKCESANERISGAFKIDSKHKLYLQSEKVSDLAGDVDCRYPVSQIRAPNDSGLFIVCGCVPGACDKAYAIYILSDTFKAHVIPINLSSISDALASASDPEILDFDVTHDGTIYLFTTPNAIVRLDRSGNVNAFISDPCLGNHRQHLYFTTLCNGQVVVSCFPDPVLKVFSADLVPLNMVSVHCGSNACGTNPAFLTVGNRKLVLSDGNHTILINTDTWKQEEIVPFASFRSYMRPDGIMIGITGMRDIAILDSDHRSKSIVNMGDKVCRTYGVISTGDFMYVFLWEDGDGCMKRSFYVRKFALV